MSDPPEVPSGPELIPCHACQHPVARTARTCPSCGAVAPWKREADLEKERRTAKIAKGVGIGCLAFVVLWILIGFIMMSSSTQDSTDSKLSDSTDCQVIAMRETGEASGPAVDAAHERCMARRGYRKK